MVFFFMVFTVSSCTGGPVLVGFAKASVSAGGSVAVTLSGALDGFTGLRPGMCLSVCAVRMC